METRAQLRAELTDAIATVKHQIGVDLASGGMIFAGPGPTGRDLAIQGLQQTLSELEKALADLEAEDAQAS